MIGFCLKRKPFKQHWEKWKKKAVLVYKQFIPKKEEFISKWNQVMEKAESSYTSGEAAMKAIDAFFSKAEEHYQ